MISSKDDRSSRRCSLTFLGDVCVQQLVNVESNVREKYDALVVNVEGPFAAHLPGIKNKILLPSDFKCFLESLGNDLVATIANNHTFDYGLAGFESTSDALRNSGIPFCGAGKDLSDSRLEPVIIECEDHRIAIVAVSRSLGAAIATDTSYGSGPLDLCFLEHQLAQAKDAGATRFVLCVHWGDEEVPAPHAEDVQLARKATEMGFDLVIGNHAHVRQFYEEHKGNFIFYGLGNAIFPELDTFRIRQDGSKVRIRKKHASCNRKSIAVNYNPTTNKVLVKQLNFDGKNLRVISVHKPKPSAFLGTGRLYQLTYKWFVLFGKGRYLFGKFIAEPKLPGPRHIRTFFKLLSKRG